MELLHTLDRQVDKAVVTGPKFTSDRYLNQRSPSDFTGVIEPSKVSQNDLRAGSAIIPQNCITLRTHSSC